MEINTTNIDNSTLKEEIQKLNENFEALKKDGKIKKVKPNKKLNNSDLKSNVVLAVVVGENKEFRFEKLNIEDSTVTLNKVPRIATAEYLGTYKGRPAMIIPEWSAEPISFQKQYDEAAKNKMLAVGYRLLLNRIELGAIKAKKQIKGWIIFAGIIALIVVGYLLLK